MNTTDAVEEMYIEIIDQAASGYIRDDTRGTPFQEEICAPGIVFVPNTGKMSEEIVDEKTKKGTGKYKNVEIRYIKDCPTIRVDEQEKAGYEKHKIPSVDTITIRKGKTLIKREGDVGLFDFLKMAFYNQQAPNRPKSAKALFKVVEVDKTVSVINEKKFLRAQAVGKVEDLMIKQGKTYKFQEAKIDSLLTLLGKFGGESPAEKIAVLTQAAEENPELFIQLITKTDETLVTEINHAIQLNVIQFVGNSVQGVADNKIFATLPDDLKSMDKKIMAFSELLKTPEFASIYQELKIKIEIEEENSVKA